MTDAPSVPPLQNSVIFKKKKNPSLPSPPLDRDWSLLFFFCMCFFVFVLFIKVKLNRNCVCAFLLEKITWVRKCVLSLHRGTRVMAFVIAQNGLNRFSGWHIWGKISTRNHHQWNQPMKDLKGGSLPWRSWHPSLLLHSDWLGSFGGSGVESLLLAG